MSLGYIADIPLNFSIVDVHMWYIYLLIGLYLFMPVFSAWVEKASEKEKASAKAKASAKEKAPAKAKAPAKEKTGAKEKSLDGKKKKGNGKKA